jgi:hypothetical protein
MDSIAKYQIFNQNIFINAKSGVFCFYEEYARNFQMDFLEKIDFIRFRSTHATLSINLSSACNFRCL